MWKSIILSITLHLLTILMISLIQRFKVLILRQFKTFSLLICWNNHWKNNQNRKTIVHRNQAKITLIKMSSMIIIQQKNKKALTKSIDMTNKKNRITITSINKENRENYKQKISHLIKESYPMSIWKIQQVTSKIN